MEILLNTEDYKRYDFDILSVAPKNLIKFLYQKAEVLKILVIVHFSRFSMSFHSSQLIPSSGAPYNVGLGSCWILFVERWTHFKTVVVFVQKVGLIWLFYFDYSVHRSNWWFKTVNHWGKGDNDIMCIEKEKLCLV